MNNLKHVKKRNTSRQEKIAWLQYSTKAMLFEKLIIDFFYYTFEDKYNLEPLFYLSIFIKLL
ncbi:hypothetical protein XJ44_01495 [Thermosipho affectus]|uniref:Uncharacterized protein n=1 Tax=Thermosipho affectus TaxID=660294 RepID=A0ABX3IK65_9BACT|nr:hypothetical protein XJ44_01495 [Thermosipho affectus]